MSAGPDDEDGEPGATDAGREDDLSALRSRVDALHEELDAFEDDVDDRTVHRSEVQSDLERYVRARLRRGHARGWGPYLVLLYGTAMTIGAFYFLSGGWAILAMLVVWLSTLGLYVLMLLVGLVFNALSLPGHAAERLRDLRR